MKASLSLLVIFILWTMPRNAKCDYPGTFFWKPRLAIDLGIHSTTPASQKKKEYSYYKRKPSVSEIRYGYGVIVRGYELSTNIIALAVGIRSWEKFPHLNPFKAWFYTTAYRWLLRHLSIYPEWLRGSDMSYIDTHRVWRKRYTQLNTFVPKWLQRLLPHVWEWKRERAQFRRYSRYAEPAFAKHYHYPGPEFWHWKSEETTETVENLDIEDRSIDVNFADY